MEATDRKARIAVVIVCTALCIGLARIGLADTATTQPAEATLTSRAEEVAKLFRADPDGLADLFSARFRAAATDEKFTRLLKQIYSSAGRCTGVKPVEPLKQYSGQFTFYFEKGSTATVRMKIDADPPHRVSSFFISALEIPAKSFDDLISQLKKLHGTASLYAGEIVGGQLKPIAGLSEDKPLALGSAFKLYVLAELVNQIEAGQRHWDDVVQLPEEAKSLPTGILQDWPTGSPLTLHTLASLMISQSDNTATDTLIRTLGREKIEAMLGTAGHANPGLNQPFLTTVEMFKIKGDTTKKLADAYAAANTEGRRQLLAGPIAAMLRSQIEFPSVPTHISDIEWFASNSDLARVMMWLKTHTEKSPADKARGVLSISSGLPISKDKWSYIGFKGGSEPGVVNMTFLLQKRGAGDRWFVVSATWNDAEKVVDEPTFFGIVQQAVELTGDKAER